jgi:phytoene dehydrogenase-like protein
MNKKKVVIIGGGISGLSTGAYLEMNGFETEVYEKCHEPGGVMVPWTRKGYNFDGATNWLPGSSKGVSEIYDILEELIDFSKQSFVDYEKFMDIERDGEVFSVYSDAEKLRDEMMRIAPEDKKQIDVFVDAILLGASLKVPFDKASDLLTFPEKLMFPFKNFSMIKFFFKWNSLTIDEFAQGFSSKILREGVKDILPHHSFFSMLALLIPLGWLNNGGAGYPMGGSRKFIDTIEQKYLSLGGKVFYKSPVNEITVEDDCATGIILKDGTEVKADMVVAATDFNFTVKNLLNSKYSNKELDGYFDNQPTFPGMIQVSLGVNREFKDEIHKVVTPFKAPVELGGGESAHSLLARICNFDTCFAPEGKTSIIVHLRGADCDYWETLRESDRAKYKEEKQRICDAVVEALDERFGGVKENLEVTDVATPATYKRYTNVFRGSYQAWAPTVKKTGVSLPRKLENLNNFYLSGQWLSTAGGMPRAIVLGRQTAQVICKEQKQKFTVAEKSVGKGVEGK